ncbi:MAG: ATP-binding cassette domain-containing protein, partial [candidate division Zixibacteria bacterium]|nr:ATP-binding cassette domain-containing protein [candidate division Zixibacteria bacterium]
MFTLENLTKIYQHRSEEVHALDKITMEIAQGSFVVVTGGSGSGKTTLLLTLGGIIHPTSGSLRVKGASLYDYSSNQLATYRNRTVGFVLQTFNLVPYLTALENVMIPMLLN